MQPFGDRAQVRAGEHHPFLCAAHRVGDLLAQGCRVGLQGLPLALARQLGQGSELRVCDLQLGGLDQPIEVFGVIAPRPPRDLGVDRPVLGHRARVCASRARVLRRGDHELGVGEAQDVGEGSVADVRDDVDHLQHLGVAFQAQVP